MFEVNGNLLETYVSYVQGALSAFLPVMTMTMGIFLAFAIANMLRHFIQRTVK